MGERAMVEADRAATGRTSKAIGPARTRQAAIRLASGGPIVRRPRRMATRRKFSSRRIKPRNVRRTFEAIPAMVKGAGDFFSRAWYGPRKGLHDRTSARKRSGRSRSRRC